MANFSNKSKVRKRSNIEIADAQMLLFMVGQLVGGNPLCYSLKVKGNIDLKELEKSIWQVVKAHPILRTKFVLKKEATSLKDIDTVLVNEDKPLITFKNIGALSSDDKINLLEDFYQQLLNKKYPLNTWPLFDFHLFKLNEEEYQFFLGIDHLISDGLSSLQILSAIFTTYQSKIPPRSISSQSYNDAIRKINDFSANERKQKEVSSYLLALKKENYLWNPEGKKVNYLEPEFLCISLIVEKETFQKLIDRASQLKVSLYALIVTAYLNVLFRYEKKETVILTLPTGGRLYPDVDVSHFIGCFAQALTISFDRQLLNMTPPERIIHIHNKIYETIENDFDKVQTKKLAHSLRNDFTLESGKISEFKKGLFRSSIKSNVYISFTGYSPLKRNYGSLEIIDFKEGSINNSATCDFMHSIFDGKLHLSINFDAKFFARETMENFITDVKKEMLQLTVFTPAFPQIGIVSFERKLRRNPGLLRQGKAALLSAAESLTVIESRAFEGRVLQKPHLEYLLKTFHELFGFQIKIENSNDDLEGRLGLDSLARIRLVTKISKDFHHKIDKMALLRCRTLSDFSNALSTNFI